MGYYTRYSLDQVGITVPRQELSALIEEDEVARQALDPDGDTREAQKWYEHEDCICAWSARFPNTLFRLHAEGEDSDGIWDKYFLNGKLLHTERFMGLPSINPDHLLRRRL